MTDDKMMPSAEIDVISFVDDDGNEFDMECVYVFEHDSKTYALLAESVPVHEHEHTHADGEECGCGEEEAFYIFEVKEDEDGAEYLAVEDDALLDELIGVIENLGIFEDEDTEE